MFLWKLQGCAGWGSPNRPGKWEYREAGGCLDREQGLDVEEAAGNAQGDGNMGTRAGQELGLGWGQDPGFGDPPDVALGWLSRNSKSKPKDAWMEHPPFPFPTPGILPGKPLGEPEEPWAHQAWHRPNVGHARPVPRHSPAVAPQSRGSSVPLPSLGNRGGRGHPPAWHQRRCSCGKSAVAAETFSP